MIEESESMREIREIREALWEETKHMTTEERIAHEHAIAEAMIKEYGLKVKYVSESKS